MSHSLLERRALGIFPGRTWLYAGGKMVTLDVDISNIAATDLAEALLARGGGGRWWRPTLDVTLSDESARIVVLPWQDGLRTSAQQLRYAEACLEDASASANVGWTMQYCYRRHGQAGIAYALPTAYLEQLTVQATVHRLRLRSVLPVAASAYWRYPLVRRSSSVRTLARSLLLLSEAHRYTLLRFEGAALTALDVQPTTGERQQALRRLLRRAQVGVATVGDINYWSHDSGDVPAQVIAECFAAATIRTLSHRSWE